MHILAENLIFYYIYVFPVLVSAKIQNLTEAIKTLIFTCNLSNI